MLGFWHPSHGPNGDPSFNTTYALPPTKDVHIPTPNMDRQQSLIQDIVGMSGSFDFSGAKPFYNSYGDIQATFFLTPNVLVERGWTGDMASMETEIITFWRWVILGGLGRLVDVLPPGTSYGDGNPGSALFVHTEWTPHSPARTCNAKVTGQPTPTRILPGDVVEIAVTFRVPSGVWTYTFSDGTKHIVPIH